jgi:hypothetical protein
MALTAHPVIKELKNYAQTLGIFDNVLTHEPLSAPAVSSTVYAMWLMGYGHAPGVSGLQSVSTRLEVQGRIYISALKQPMDNIDGQLLALASAVYDSYCTGFTFGGLVKQVDIFGENGNPLAVTFGHITQDSKLFRVADVVIPLIMNDQHDEVS